MSPSASARRSSRYVRLGRVLEKVLAVRFEPDAGVLGCSPVFVVGVQLLKPLTGNLWTLDDFKGNLALLVGHSSCSSPPEFFSSPVVDNGKCVPFAILLFLGWGISGGALIVCSIRVVPVLIGFSSAVCRWSGRSKTLLKLTIPRIKLLWNRRELQLRQMRRDITKLLEATDLGDFFLLFLNFSEIEMVWIVSIL